MLLRGDELFVLKRAKTGFMDGYYTLPGGHQRMGESVEAAVRRECEEETGVEVVQVRAVCVMPYRSGRHQGLNFVFEVCGWRGEPHAAEPELFSAASWVSKEAIPHPAVPWISNALDAHAEGRWFHELHWD